ncbi:maleate cis-trans isomerase family protein [Occultella gossypii]|uniref:Aspartate/glutamate racemase family protein n=1 Tax=Occultella gossypii TaxID=2800820 RepID=A0ABS7S808_9MICO|nr:maleate cis-trans isomerase [Occultella gossypii]MBZ2196488.1 aspartate/glutamate racemase family protein [Occultella gossypii]
MTVGFIYPDHAAEDDYPFAADLLGVHLPVAHVYGTDLHAVPELLDLGSPARLAEGARQLERAQPDAVIWACTSGSFVFGPDGARAQADALAAVAGVPASSTSFAFVHALQALGIRRVTVVASYPTDVATLFGQFLAAAGIEIVSMSSAGIHTAAEVATLTGDQVLELATDNDHPDAEAMLIPDTAMHTLREVMALEQRIGRPVLTANQVSVWEGLRLAGLARSHPRLGRLFRRAVG